MQNLLRQALDCPSCQQQSMKQCHCCGKFLCSQHYFVWPSVMTQEAVWCFPCGYEANLIDQHGQSFLDDDDWA